VGVTVTPSGSAPVKISHPGAVKIVSNIGLGSIQVSQTAPTVPKAMWTSPVRLPCSVTNCPAKRMTHLMIPVLQ
jgi:hypothetical protein